MDLASLLIDMVTHPAAQVQLLLAGGLGSGMPPSPPSKRQLHKPQGLYCQLMAPDPVTAQTHLILWPLCFVHNRLPHPVRWQLTDSQEPLLPSGSQQMGRISLSSAPGDCLPLPLSPEGSQLLSISQEAATPGATRSPFDSSCQMQTRPAASGTAAQPAQGSLQRPGVQLTPALGQTAAVSIAGPDRPPLTCTLSASSLAPDVPVLQLSLLPQAVVHNCTGMALLLEAPGAYPGYIPADRSTALDWQPLQVKPLLTCFDGGSTHQATLCSSTAWGAEALRRCPSSQVQPGKALLALEAASAGGLPLRLRSELFTMEPGEQQVLLQTEAPPAAVPLAPGSVQSKGAQVTKQPPAILLLVVSINVERHDAGGKAVPAGRSRGSPRSCLHEVVHITVCAGCHVSNLSPCDLLLTPLHAVAATPVAAGAARHRQIRVRGGGNVPLLLVWQPLSWQPAAQAAAQLRQQVVVGIAPPAPGRQSPSKAASPQRMQPSRSKSGPLRGQTKTSECLVSLSQPCGRRRLPLQRQDGGSMLLSYRIIHRAGSTHLVRDT